MRTGVKIDGEHRVYDLSRVKSWHDLKVGSRVLLKHPYTRELREGKVTGLFEGCVTVEFFNRHEEPDYKMIQSGALYSRVYRIN